MRLWLVNESNNAPPPISKMSRRCTILVLMNEYDDCFDDIEFNNLTLILKPYSICKLLYLMTTHALNVLRFFLNLILASAMNYLTPILLLCFLFFQLSIFSTLLPVKGITHSIVFSTPLSLELRSLSRESLLTWRITISILVSFLKRP